MRSILCCWRPMLMRLTPIPASIPVPPMWPGRCARLVATAICTNKPEGLAETLMQRLGVRDLFGALIGADTLPTRKPDPAPYLAAVRLAGNPTRSVLIGDTDTDRKTAAAAGVPCILVSFGPEGPGISRLQPEAMLHDYRDLPVGGAVSGLITLQVQAGPRTSQRCCGIHRSVAAWCGSP